MATTRREFLRQSAWAGAGLVGAGAGACRGAKASPAKRPHIVLFVGDDHGVDDCGAYGDRVVKTPAIDRLAREGMRFTGAFAASPLCSPSRCVMGTGLMPFRNGGHKFGTPIRPGLRTMPTYFKQLGYHTAHVGKFHHAPRKQFPYDTVIRSESGAPAFLAKYRGDKPLLLVVCSTCPHTPWPARSDYDPAKIKLPPTFVDTPETRADRARYYSEVTTMDRQLGAVLAGLVRRGWDKNTLVLFTSDQGSNWPFAKWCLYDAGIRVPLIARWPGRVRPGATTDAMVSLADLLPTMMAAAGAPAPKDIDGRSFLDVLTGAEKQHREAVFACHTGNDNGGPGIANHCPMRCVRTPRYKYILNLHPERTFYTHIVGCKPPSPHHLPFWQSWVERAKTDAGARRIVNAYLHRPKEELYDILADPHEQRNLAGEAEHAKALAEMRKLLAAWRKQQGDPEL